MSDTDVMDQIEQMYATMEHYSDFGAFDTEPRSIFASLLDAQLKGDEPKVPTSADGWNIFADMDGADIAANHLTGQARRVLEAANADHRAFVKAYTYYFGEPTYF
ncbi:hypothetical protein SEA_SHAM4_83 [Mycobacterium phage Sham4]|uniref:hypothetical protein n=1 Tax=Mycobacterium phage Mulciber TaxID=1805459 RepID=UPI00078EA8DE|nr:hypothetical protein BJD74_gp23 [Mycobacterium phage Mulciber]AQT28257.1 hypothetical protein SEA_JABITH_86 [Mycobacterium phage Jabith]ASR86724.1 hypothetical protein SEA_ET2BRUTUS_86 [Mycobacterium phage Et2Brutus]QBI99109.1 hypothetical protein SEA_SALZ_82 [Mycobacterium phage Salz]QBP32559.1 hypothetical protein SEA_FIBONACCI_86 [Mycobacterium phage Fibonacci]QFG05061.1 hypothetical protein SEA_HUTC2_83 [Mycobacterium phage Hutc2]UOW92728.1 hypothetical protein SEA_SHAM4_83 [Mycobacter